MVIRYQQHTCRKCGQRYTYDSQEDKYLFTYDNGESACEHWFGDIPDNPSRPGHAEAGAVGENKEFVGGEDLSKFIVTFGQLYRREAHPRYSLAHPDGVLVINARDERAAREKAFRTLGDGWAFMHRWDDFGPNQWAYFPRGVIEEWEE
jgi:hypothetical protein